MSYTLTDVKRLISGIRKELPDAQISNHGDYGWTVAVKLGDRACIACQAPEEAIGRPEIFRSPAEIKEILCGPVLG